MIRALVFDTDAPFLEPGAAPSPLAADRRLAGLTLVRRAALIAWRAGAAEVTIVSDEPSRWAREAAEKPVRISCVAPDAVPDLLAGTGEVLLLSAQVLPQPELPAALLAAARREGRSLVATAAAAGCPGPAVLIPPAPGGGPAGALVPGTTSPSPSSPEEGSVERPRGGGHLPQPLLAGCEPLRVDDGSYRRLDSPRALAAADRDLYRGLTSVTDGYVDHVFNRRISAWFTRRVIGLPVTPNAITWFHFALGMVAAGLFWQGSYGLGVLGALLFQLSVALDCSDGEVARLKFQFSRFGSWLDVWTDNVVHVCIFAAIARAAGRSLGAGLALTLGALAVAGVLMCVLVIFSLARLQSRRRPGEASTLAATNRLSERDQAAARSATLVDRVINEATSRDFSVLVVFFALIGRLEWFAWLAAVGSHLFWVIFAAIQLAMLRTANAESR